jgi:hypothetical protein
MSVLARYGACYVIAVWTGRQYRDYGDDGGGDNGTTTNSGDTGGADGGGGDG